MAEQLGIFDLIGQVGEQLSKSGYLRDVGEAAQASDFTGDVATASAENDRRVARAVKKGRMSPEYRRSQGIDPVKQDFAREQFKAKRDFFLANRPKAQFEQPDYDPSVFEYGQNLIDAYDAVATETPQERMAINAPARLPSTPVDSTALDYTGSVGVPEYTPEYVNKAVADVEAGRYNPDRIARDVATTVAKIPMMAMQTGLDTANLLSFGALDPLVQRYREGSQDVENILSSDFYKQSGQEIQNAINRKDLPFIERMGGVGLAMAENAPYVVSQAIGSAGSMFLPTLAAKGVTGLNELAKVSPALARFARFIPSPEKASQYVNDVMNAGGVFSADGMENVSLLDRLKGAAIAGIGSNVVGRITEGGAEGAIARDMQNEAQQAEESALKAFFKEYAQEKGEGISADYGESVAKDEDFDIEDSVAKNTFEGVAGGITGLGTNLGLRMRNAGRAMQNSQVIDNQIANNASTGNIIGAVLDAVQKANPPVQQAPSQQATPKPQQKPVQQKPVTQEQNAQPVVETPAPVQQSANPIDVIKNNGGISRDTLTDMGWNDKEIDKLPSGFVSAKGGMSLEQAQDALYQSGNDNDVEALADYASRPQYAPEQQEQQQPVIDNQIQQENPVAQVINATAEQKQQTEAKQAEQVEQVPAQEEQKPLTRQDTQNRQRDRVASITQMNGIASNPDYGRLSVSRSLEGSGAPVVYGDETNVAFGRSDVMTQTDGKKIPFRYGVVDADNLIASNDINGTRIPEYDTGATGKLRAIAGNGRTAGLKEAYSRGTAGDYRKSMIDDVDAHGVSADIIAGMKNPVLVRVIDQKNVTKDTADLSNQSSSMDLSKTEQAMNDARRVKWDSLSFDEETGNITTQSVIDFIREMPKAEQNSMIDEYGEPTANALTRFQSAIFQKAYDSPGLANKLNEKSIDEKTSNIIKAMMNVANKFVVLRDSGEFDITPMVVRAAEDAINAQKAGRNLNEYSKNIDFTREPEADVILRMFATNSRSHKKISEALGNLADGMISAYNAQGSMFGDSPTREQAFNNWSNNYGNEQESRAGVQEQGRTEYAPENDAGQVQSERTSADTEATARPEQEEQQEESGLTLEQTTPEQVKADEEKAKAEAKRKADEAKKAEQKAKADEELGHFSLSGSDSQEDILIGQGQGSMFDNQGNVEKKAEQKPGDTAKVFKDEEKDNVVHVSDSASKDEQKALSSLRKQFAGSGYIGNKFIFANAEDADAFIKKANGIEEAPAKAENKSVLTKSGDKGITYDYTGMNEKIATAIDVLAEEMGGEINYNEPSQGKSTLQFKSAKDAKAFANKANGIIKKFTETPPKKINHRDYVDVDSQRFKDAYNEALKYAKDLNWSDKDVADGIESRDNDLANLTDIDFLRRSEQQIKDTINGIAGFRDGLVVYERQLQTERKNGKKSVKEERQVSEGKQTETATGEKNSFGIPLEHVTEFNTVTKKALNEALLELANQDLDNDLEGVSARVSSTQRGKIKSAEAQKKSVENGFTNSQHFGIASKIKDAWKWAAFAREEKHKSGESNATAEKYVSAVRVGEKDAFAFITVIKSSDGRRIYSVELITKEKLGGNLSAPSTKLVDRNTPAPSLDEIIAKLSGKVKESEKTDTKEQSEKPVEESAESESNQEPVSDFKDYDIPPTKAGSFVDINSEDYKKAYNKEKEYYAYKDASHIESAINELEAQIKENDDASIKELLQSGVTPTEMKSMSSGMFGRLHGMMDALESSKSSVKDSSIKEETKEEQNNSDSSLKGTDYESVNNAVDKMRSGDITIGDLKRVAIEALNNEQSIKESLNKLTLAQLKPMVSIFTRGKKADYVNAAYSQLLFELLPVDTFSTVYGSGQTFEQQYEEKVNSLTQDDIKKYSDNLKEKRNARQKALTNPETLDEFRTFRRVKGYEALTSKQKAVYDDLLATEKREKAQQEKEKPEPQKKKTDRAVTGRVSAEIVEQKHTKTGETIHVVKLGDKTESDVFKSLKDSAKESGGYYSRFAKGFLFKDRANAESFLNVVNGMAETSGNDVNADSIEENEEQPVSRSVERMREVAQANIDRAEAKLNADRNTNTARRARIASGIEEEARRDIRKAKTMMNIADAIERGDARHLVDINTMTQVDLLDRLLSHARNQELIEKYPNYPERLKQDYEDVSEDTVNYAKYPDGENASDWRKRLERAGITDIVMLRAALREYATLRSDRVERDKVKDAERAIVGRKVGEDFFPTPPDVASRMAEMANISDGDRVLEPSAGSGNLADAAKQAGGKVDAIEIDSNLRNILDAKGYDVVAEDFTDYEPSEKYDVVIMNPPFSNRRDAEHIMRAFDMLKDGGRLVAIAGEGVFFGRDKKAEAFRTWLDNHGAYIEKLPENTFSDKKLLNTTGANARLIKITKRSDAQYATRNMPAHDAYSTVDEVVESLKADKANKAAVVVQSIDDLPSHLREQAEERNPETVEGVYDPETNKPYLIADNITDPERALEVARHEVIAHYGIEGMLGEERMNDIADKVTDALKRGIKVIKEYSERVNETHGGLDERTHAKEIIAKMSEDGIQNSITRRVWNAIKSFMNSIGLGRFDMTEKEVADILREARQAVIENGGEMSVGGGPAEFSKGALSDPVPENPMDGIRDALASEVNSVHPYYYTSAEAIIEAEKHGLDIARFKHTIDTSSIKHTNKQHRKNASTEIDRGQVPLSDKDYFRIPEIVTSPDMVAYGTVTSRKHPQIAYVKAFDDGVILYIEEYRVSRRTLNTQSMRKYPPATRASSVVKTLGLNVQNDKGYRDNVEENPVERNRKKALFSINGNTKPISNQAQSAFDTKRKEFEVPDITRFENIRRAMQDRMIDVKRVIDAIREDGGYVTEREDTYRKEELYSARLKNRIDKLDEDWVTPILESAKDTGMTVEEIDKWLAARHILLDKVNERLADINPNHPDKNRLSGMTDDEAQDIFHKGAGNKALYKVGELIDRLTRRNVQQRVVNGLMTQAEADQWNQYKHYVPLNRDNGNNGGFGSSPKNFEVKGKESKRRMGSTKEVVNVLANLFADSVEVAQRIEKARVTRSLLDLARNHPNDDFWTVDIPKTIMRVDKQSGLVEMSYRDENLVPANNVVVVKENGKEHWITFNKNNERAMRIAQAMKNLDVEQVNGVIGAVGKITRYMGQWMTSKNPAFMFSNFLRDVQDAAFNLADTPISGKELQLVGTIPSAMKAIWQMDRGTQNGNSEMAKYAREFREAGGETAFIESRGSIQEQAEALEKRLKDLVDGKPTIRNVMETMGGVIENANNAVENSVRLATYVTARKNGLSRDKSASLAKNITVNFNRRGTSTGVINSLYLFANANIQGHTRMIQAMTKSRKAQIVGGLLVGASFALSMLGRGVMGDAWDDISPWEKENNWIFPINKNGDYIKIPIGPGLKLFHYAGTMFEDQIFNENRMSPLEMALNIAITIADNFNVAGAGSSPGQIIVPTVFRPAVQLWENKKFNGSPIHAPSTDPFTGYEAPAYQKAFGTTPRHWTAVSKWLSNMSGGDNVMPGKVNIAPESIAFAIKAFAIPGTANEIDRVVTLAEQTMGKEKITVSPQMVPLVNRVYGHADEGRNMENMYKQISKWKQTIGEIRAYDKEHQNAMGYDKSFLRKKANKHLGWSEKGTNHMADLGNGNQQVGALIYKNFKDFQSEMTDINKRIRAANSDGNRDEARRLTKLRKDTFIHFRETGKLKW